jgi:sugar lactone lactonase YvrE
LLVHASVDGALRRTSLPHGRVAAAREDPNGLAFGPDGRLYLSEYDDNVVRVIDTDGVIETFAGTGAAGASGDGGQADDAELAGPGDLVFDPEGNLLISDQDNGRIRRVSAAGVITTFAAPAAE